MAISMRGDLVTSSRDLLDHLRPSFSLPTQNEERRLGAVLVENVQNAAGILLDTAFIGRPIFETNRRVEGRHLIVVFYVNGQRVQHLGLASSNGIAADGAGDPAYAPAHASPTG